MNKLEQAARQALEALHNTQNALLFVSGSIEQFIISNMTADAHDDADKAITALREALAEPDIEEMTLTQIAAKYEQAEQEPVAYMFKVKRTLPSSVPLDVFAAIEYTPLPHEDIISKEPLYAAPVSIEAAVLAEREACAKVCEEVDVNNKGFPLNAKTYAAAIRARGNDK